MNQSCVSSVRLWIYLEIIQIWVYFCVKYLHIYLYSWIPFHFIFCFWHQATIYFLKKTISLIKGRLWVLTMKTRFISMCLCSIFTHTHTHKEKEKEKCIPLFCIKQESKHHKKLSMSVSNLVLVCWLLQQEFVQYRHLFIGIIEINLINKVIAYSIYCYCCCLSPFFTPSFFLVFKLNLEQTNSDFIGPQIAFSF